MTDSLWLLSLENIKDVELIDSLHISNRMAYRIKVKKSLIPINDIKVVSIVALTDDVVATVDYPLEHGVQDVLHLILSKTHEALSLPLPVKQLGLQRQPCPHYVCLFLQYTKQSKLLEGFECDRFRR